MKHRSIDGALISIDDPGRMLVETFTSIGEAWTNGSFLEFIATTKASGREIFEEIYSPPEYESRAFHGGQLHIGRAFDRGEDGAIETDAEVMLFEHERGSLTSWQPWGSATTFDELLAELDIEATEEGLALRASSSLKWDSDPVLAKHTTLDSLAEIRPLTSEAAKSLPRWKGAIVDGGELFLDERPVGAPEAADPAARLAADSDPNRLISDGYLLVGLDSVVRARFSPVATEDKLLARMQHLNVSWDTES